MKTNIFRPTPLLYCVCWSAPAYISQEDMDNGRTPPPAIYQTQKMTYDEAETKVEAMRERQPDINVWIEAA